jgi:hypothetical protein
MVKIEKGHFIRKRRATQTKMTVFLFGDSLIISTFQPNYLNEIERSLPLAFLSLLWILPFFSKGKITFSKLEHCFSQ